MSLAYVLLKCNDGSEKQILDEIKSIKEVKEAQETFGPFSAVVKLESNNSGKFKQILNEKICCIDGVNSSTMLMSPFENSPKIESKPTWEDV